MNKIVIPVDFSDCSKEAVAVGAQIGKKLNSEIVFVHWYTRPFVASLNPANSQVSSTIDGEKDEAYKNTVNQQIATLIDEYDLGSLKVQKLLIFEKTVKEVFQMKELTDAALIVMGTKGASNLKELFVGSNTQKVVRYADCPVLAIKSKLDINFCKDFIFSSDFNNKGEQKAFKSIEPIVNKLGLKTHLLKVITPSYFEDSNTSKAKIDSFIKETSLENYEISVYNNYSPEEGITEYSQGHENSIIGIATNAHKGFSHFLNGSISEDLVNRLDKPILTFKL